MKCVCLWLELHKFIGVKSEKLKLEMEYSFSLCIYAVCVYIYTNIYTLLYIY